MWDLRIVLAPESFTQNPVINYTNFEDKTTTLIVSNGVSSNTATANIIFSNYLLADFDVTPVICPENKAIFTNKSLTNSIITNYKWTIENGSIITVKDPAPQTYIPLETADYFALPAPIITNDYGCRDTIKRKIQVVNTCFIAVPSAFTPNGDGLNDYLYPLKAYKRSCPIFSVFNRFGHRFFYSPKCLITWDGKHNT